MNSITDICSAVKKIAWGYLLMFLDFNVMTVNVLPDWVGYIMVVSALSCVIIDEETLRKLRPIGIVLVIWNMVEWVVNIFGIGVYLVVFSIVATILNLYFTWHLFGNLAAIAEKYSCPQEGKLRGWRIPNMIFTVISSVISYASLLIGEGEVAVVGSLVLLPLMLILMIFILVVLFSFASSLGKIKDTPVIGIQPMPSNMYMPPPPIQYRPMYNDENKPE